MAFDGDKNTKYFHKQAKSRKNHNAVSEIIYNGDLIKDFEGIKQAAHASFKDLYTAPIEDLIDTNAHPFDPIPNLIKQEDNNLLTTPVTMNELKEILSIMKPDSAPGPDGFTTRFFTSC